MPFRIRAHRTLALFPEDRCEALATDAVVVRLRLGELRLCRPRQWGACTHRLDQARRADQIVVVQEGRIAEVGTHARLLRADCLYAALYRLQSVTQARSAAKTPYPCGTTTQRT